MKQLKLFEDFLFVPGAKVYTKDGQKHGIITSFTDKPNLFWVSYLEYNGDKIRCDWCFYKEDLSLSPIIN